MNNYNQEKNTGRRMTGVGFRGKRTGGRRFDSRSLGRSDMFPATCDKCGKSCEVPFRPTSGRPIFCSDCFEGKGGRRNENFDRRDFGRRDFSRRHFGRTSMYQAICDECGKNCEVPFRPTAGKPVFCDECFETKGKKKDNFVKLNEGDNYEKLKKQIDIINAKLDRILISLEPAAIDKLDPKENISPKLEETKEVKTKKVIKKTVAKKKKPDSKEEMKSI